MSFVEYIITKCLFRKQFCKQAENVPCLCVVWSLFPRLLIYTDNNNQNSVPIGGRRVLGYRLSSSFSFRCSIWSLFFDIGVGFFLWIYREDTCFFLNRYNDSYSQCNQGSAPDDHGDEIRSRSIQIVWISAGLFHKPKQFSKWLAIKKII